MKLITRDTSYALHAICYLSKQKDRIISVDELVKELKVPRAFARKILQKLNKEGILKSYKGAGGGFSLNKRPEDIYLLDVMQVFQGPFKLNECVFKKMPCPEIKKCRLKKKLDTIEDYILKELKGINLKKMMSGKKL
jgi:Rrf2 family protein